MKIHKDLTGFSSFFVFLKTDSLINGYETCYYCNNTLSTAYIRIINKLKRQDLLPKDYKKICCSCYIMKDSEIIDYDPVYTNETMVCCDLIAKYKGQTRVFNLKNVKSLIILKKLIHNAKSMKDLQYFKQQYINLNYKNRL